MPSMKDSSNPDLSNLTPVNAPTQQTQQPSLPAPTDRSAFMLASMPPLMSQGDLIGSQFYPVTNVPVHRTMPVRGGNQ
jgi:hypothetical protein